jgi:NDP-sugar pyrophosphorylase family protein
MRIAAAALSMLLAAPALAGDDDARTRCVVKVGRDELAAEGKDLLVRPGPRWKSAVAVRGNVVVQKGARVDEVAAVGGSVTLEEGDAAAIGGKLRIEEGGAVKGEKSSVDVSLNGMELGQKIRDGVVAGNCTVEREGSDGR